VPFKVVLLPAALKTRAKLDSQIRAKVDEALKKLETDPRPPGSVQLTDWKPPKSRRIRVAGDWRVIVNDATQDIDVSRIAHRSESY